MIYLGFIARRHLQYTTYCRERRVLIIDDRTGCTRNGKFLIWKSAEESVHKLVTSSNEMTNLLVFNSLARCG